MKINGPKKRESNISENVFKLFDVSYDELMLTHSNELYRLRKRTFSDRLGWDVVCNNDMEFDEFDNSSTRYILGLCNGQLICSVRFISLDQPNMFTQTFRSYFETVSLPSEGYESSRFFVDKLRAQQILGKSYPVSRILYLAMINWARCNKSNGIYTIVSQPMLKILQKSGWQILTLKKALLHEKENIFLVFLPTTTEDQAEMAAGIITKINCKPDAAVTWPLLLPA